MPTISEIESAIFSFLVAAYVDRRPCHRSSLILPEKYLPISPSSLTLSKVVLYFASSSFLPSMFNLSSFLRLYIIKNEYILRRCRAACHKSCQSAHFLIRLASDVLHSILPNVCLRLCSLMSCVSQEAYTATGDCLGSLTFQMP